MAKLGGGEFIDRRVGVIKMCMRVPTCLLVCETGKRVCTTFCLVCSAGSRNMVKNIKRTGGGGVYKLTRLVFVVGVLSVK